jgi:hypothetical protein
MAEQIKSRRWMKSMLAQADQQHPALPWARGSARAAMIARREDTQSQDVERRSA